MARKLRIAGFGEPLPASTVAGASYAAVNKGLLLYRLGAPDELPHEAYLRHLLQVDPDDTASLLEFTLAVGVVTMPAEAFVRLVNPPELGLTTFLQALVEERRREVNDGIQSDDLAVVSLTYVAFSIRFLQSLVRHWIATIEGDDVGQVWGWAVSERHARIVPDVYDALFEVGLNTHLTPFAPRVSSEGEPSELNDLLGAWNAPTPAHALALQLYNALVEGLPLRHCPECGGTFQRHAGRAKARQFRTTGVTYCSSRCARLKADRDYKAKLRARKSRDE